MKDMNRAKLFGKALSQPICGVRLNKPSIRYEANDAARSYTVASPPDCSDVRVV